MEYDFEKSFFWQFNELKNNVPLQSLFNINVEKSEYCNNTSSLKECYLCF
jgi:hypothetical protein